MSVQAALELRLPNRACRTFPGISESVAAVREWIAVELAGTGLPVADVQLAASELATNAILHSRSGGDEFLAWVGHCDVLARVVVVDDGPVPDRPVDHERSGKRGLLIVQELASAYGSHFDAETGCHAAWFEINTPTFPEGA